MKFYTVSQISKNLRETPEGYLVCIGVPIARTGDMVYGKGETPLEADANGQVTITRTPEEVFRPETIASFEGKPVTITHPEDFVTPDNWKELAKGILQNVRRGEGDQADDMITDILVTDKTTIDLIKAGLREVSCGYEAEYIQTEPGRGTQTNIIGNHLALVDQGRAGSAYAINDHKAKGDFKMTLKDRMKAIFAKAQDEAMKMADEEAGKEKPAEKEEKKKTDDAPTVSMDQLYQAVQDLAAMMKPKAKDAPEEKKAEKKVEKEAAAEDVGEEAAAEAATGEASIDDRMKAVEAAIKQILSQLNGEEESTEEEAMVGDDEMIAEDDDFEETTMTGDAASRMEILAPGFKSKAKDAKSQALKKAYATKDGKKVIDALSGGKAPAFDNAQTVETLFIAASELMKSSRAADLSKSKQTRDSNSDVTPKGPMTAEKMNEMNAQFYKRN